jgi:hypothetical protein
MRRNTGDCLEAAARARCVSPATASARGSLHDTPKGDGGLNSLCSGFSRFLRSRCRADAGDGGVARPAGALLEIMRRFATDDADRGRNDCCTCASGREWRHWACDAAAWQATPSTSVRATDTPTPPAPPSTPDCRPPRRSRPRSPRPLRDPPEQRRMPPIAARNVAAHTTFTQGTVSRCRESPDRSVCCAINRSTSAIFASRNSIWRIVDSTFRTPRPATPTSATTHGRPCQTCPRTGNAASAGASAPRWRAHRSWPRRRRFIGGPADDAREGPCLTGTRSAAS